MKPRVLCLALLPLALASINAQAADGDWFLRVGAHAVDPKSDNGALAGGALSASIDSNIQPTFALGRQLSPHWSLELLAALPFRHTVALDGGDALDFKHLPPVLSLQYLFLPDATVSPFVGLGVNYTYTFDEEERGALVGTRTRVGNSFGPAAQVGLRFRTSKAFDVIVDARWADIEADVTVNGADVGSVDVDPLVYGVALQWRF